MKSQMTFMRAFDEKETPVAMMSMSISPVFGSVALCCIAVRIKRVASSMSHDSTVGERRIFARDSEMRMSDSSCLGVAVMVLEELPMERMRLYSMTRTSTMASGMTGWTKRRA